jgi:hypothetical protein
MNPIDKGVILEEIYRKKLMEKLVGDASVKEQLADRIMYGTNNQSPLSEMANKPVYEELRQIPLTEQLKLMGEQFKSLPKTNEETIKQRDIRNTFPLYKGQRLG